MKIHSNSEGINKGQWNNLVSQHPLSSVFQRYEWIRALETLPDYIPRHITVHKKNSIIGIFPNFLSTIADTPFYRLHSVKMSFGGPLIISKDRDSLSLMIEKTEEICGDFAVLFHEISPIDNGFIKYTRLLEELDYQPKVTSCRWVVELTQGYERIIETMGRKGRNKIRKSRKVRDEVCDQSINKESLREFHQIYEQAMNRVGGYVVPFSFLKGIFDNCPNRLKIFTAYSDDKPVGSHLYLLDLEQQSVHHFFSAVKESNFEYLPSESIHDHVMQWAIENAYLTYDFGATPPHFDNGLFKYKQKFGGQLIPSLSWRKKYHPLPQPLFDASKSAYKHLRNFWQK